MRQGYGRALSDLSRETAASIRFTCSFREGNTIAARADPLGPRG
jgi:hypothetical protein